MNMIDEKVEITEANIDEMSQLAEEVVDELYSNYQCYDADGRRIMEKYREWERRWARDFFKKLEAISKEEPNAVLLFNLFRRGDDFLHVRRYTKEDIIPWIEPIIPKALQLFRNGEVSIDFVVAKSVPDDYLIAAFARAVRTEMMFYAGQKFVMDSGERYLLLLEDPNSHDGDEWRGIYLDDVNLRRAFERVSAELEELKKNDKHYRSFRVGIWRFLSISDLDYELFQELYDDKMERFNDDDFVRERQEIWEISPEELTCFKEK